MSRALPQIVLGTAQLGLAYGRRQRGAALSQAAAESILDHAWDIGIRCFDTAEAYGSASQRLASWLTARKTAAEAQVVTKVMPGAPAAQIRHALRPFHAVASRTILSHGPIIGREWDAFHDVASAAHAQAGQSVYTPEEVQGAAALSGVSRIQAPGNVFDRRALKARGAAAPALDLRSVYLQGVLLEAPEDAERRAPGTGLLAQLVAAAAGAVGESPDVLLVASMLSMLRADDRLVIGVDAAEQLELLLPALTLQHDVVSAFGAELEARRPEVIPVALLDPRSWVSV